MTKEKIILNLQSSGYEADIENGVVMVQYHDKPPAKELTALKSFIRGHGYAGSLDTTFTNDNTTYRIQGDFTYEFTGLYKKEKDY